MKTILKKKKKLVSQKQKCSVSRRLLIHFTLFKLHRVVNTLYSKNIFTCKVNIKNFFQNSLVEIYLLRRWFASWNYPLDALTSLHNSNDAVLIFFIFTEDSTNAYLNANWRPVADSLNPILSKTIEDIMGDILKRVFDNLPANFFLGDLEWVSPLYNNYPVWFIV